MDCTPAYPPLQDSSRRYLVGSLPAVEKFNQACPYGKAMSAYSSWLGCHVVFNLTCKRWGCRKCGPRKARRMAYRVEEAKPNKFITLTVRPEYMETPRQCYDRSRRNLAELAKVLRKRLGEFEYLRVLEVHKSGYPHYHLMARCPYIPQKDISAAWSALTNAPIVDVRKIDKNDNVFRYMVKYLCKQTLIPWTNRRVSWTRNFMQPPDEDAAINLDLANYHRSKLTPAEYIAQRYTGQEIHKLTDTAFVILPKPGHETYKFSLWYDATIHITEEADPQDPDPTKESAK